MKSFSCYNVLRLAARALWSSADHALAQVQPRQIFTRTLSKYARKCDHFGCSLEPCNGNAFWEFRTQGLQQRLDSIECRRCVLFYVYIILIKIALELLRLTVSSISIALLTAEVKKRRSFFRDRKLKEQRYFMQTLSRAKAINDTVRVNHSNAIC